MGATVHGRDWLWLEVLGLVGVLVAGAALRFWLSTVVPFDDAELAVLLDASVPDRSGRVPFIMLNGVTLLLLYVTVRRSAGVAAAFAALLLLQTSLVVQEELLRIAIWPLPTMLGAAVIVVARSRRPPWRAPRRVALALAAVAALLAARGIVVVASLPDRLEAIRRGSHTDPAALYASARRCGLGLRVEVRDLNECDLAWPVTRSLDQQESLLRTRSLLGADAMLAIDASSLSAARAEHDGIAVFDASGAAFHVVPDEARARIAQRLVRSRAPGTQDVSALTDDVLSALSAADATALAMLASSRGVRVEVRMALTETDHRGVTTLTSAAELDRWLAQLPGALDTGGDRRCVGECCDHSHPDGLRAGALSFERACFAVTEAGRPRLTYLSFSVPE